MLQVTSRDCYWLAGVKGGTTEHSPISALCEFQKHFSDKICFEILILPHSLSHTQASAHKHIHIYTHAQTFGSNTLTQGFSPRTGRYQHDTQIQDSNTDAIS
jgi:hypothetical protein